MHRAVVSAMHEPERAVCRFLTGKEVHLCPAKVLPEGEYHRWVESPLPRVGILSGQQIRRPVGSTRQVHSPQAQMMLVGPPQQLLSHFQALQGLGASLEVDVVYHCGIVRPYQNMSAGRVWEEVLQAKKYSL